MQFYFSLVIPFKDRPIDVLERCLESLSKQTFQDFELILINDGSEAALSRNIEDLLIRFPFVKYIYNESRGLFWSKSRVINQALRYTHSDKLVIVDTDLIFSENFLEIAASTYREDIFLVYKFYYLPENFAAYQELGHNFGMLKNTLRKSDLTNFGTFILAKKELLEIGGCDDFYKIWGGDYELENRLKNKNIQHHTLDHPEMYVFHQWHPRNPLPKGWLKVYPKHFQETKNRITLEEDKFFPLFTIQSRPALQKRLQTDYTDCTKITIEFPKEESWNIFLQRFQNLQAGEFLYIEQDFAPARIQKKSKLGFFIQWMNRLLQRVPISYRMVDLETSETEFISLQEIKTFIFYFVLHYETHILDYFIEIKGEEVFFMVAKK